MDKRSVIVGLLGLISIEMAVLDYVALQAVRNGLDVEISEQELIEAGAQAEEDMFNEGAAE